MSQYPPAGQPPFQPQSPQEAKAQAKAEKAYKKSLRPWYKKKRFIIPIAFVALLAIAQMANGGDAEPAKDRDTATAAAVETSAAAEETTAVPDETTAAAAETTPAPDVPEPVVGNGTHKVGTDIQAGTYRSDGATSICYWERLSSFDGEFESIIANGNLAPEILTIDPTDAGFSSQGCGDWFVLEDTFPDAPATSFADGTFAIGGHIEPGTYSAGNWSGLLIVEAGKCLPVVLRGDAIDLYLG